MVEEIKELRPELQFLILTEPEMFANQEIDGGKAGSNHGGASEITERPQFLRSERARIEPQLWRSERNSGRYNRVAESAPLRNPARRIVACTRSQIRSICEIRTRRLIAGPVPGIFNGKQKPTRQRDASSNFPA